MKKVKIAVVGRPNVGKSSLFNRLVGRRISIVDEKEGVTRDRIYYDIDFFGKTIQLIDTGGIDEHSLDPFQKHIHHQAKLAIEECDGIILVVDGTCGPIKMDEKIARDLLRYKKPIALAVNKIDTSKHELLIHEFHGLGIEDIIGVSALHGNKIPELIDALLEKIAFEEEEELEETSSNLKVAIIGKPNAGKSTLLNHILKEERVVASPIAGTTRDSIDVEVTIDGKAITLIDTAGIRRKHKEKEAVDKFAAIRTQKAIEKADICILMLDANEGLTAQEKGIISRIESLGKGLVLFFNKWDLVNGYRMEHCEQALKMFAPFTQYCPVIFGSAKTGRNVEDVFSAVLKVEEMMNLRISTGQLNKFIEKTVQKVHPPMIQGKRLRIYYMTQVSTQPPKFVLFVNYPERMTLAYKRYLINEFRQEYQFTGVPLFFSLKAKIEQTIEERLSAKTMVESSFIEQSMADVEEYDLFEPIEV
jgi:GTP-binding protein